jgi:hypothetical protein
MSIGGGVAGFSSPSARGGGHPLRMTRWWERLTGWFSACCILLLSTAYRFAYLSHLSHLSQLSHACPKPVWDSLNIVNITFTAVFWHCPAVFEKNVRQCLTESVTPVNMEVTAIPASRELRSSLGHRPTYFCPSPTAFCLLKLVLSGCPDVFPHAQKAPRLTRFWAYHNTGGFSGHKSQSAKAV